MTFPIKPPLMNKKYLPLILACLCTLSSFANGIKFNENKAWKEILAMAKKENKLIFMDAYATWCGPCKAMQRDVFTDTKVGEFYNDAFINVKMDMEKGEGVKLSENYTVMAYPTLLFINGDGEVVHKSVGGMEAQSFISLGINALDPTKQFYTLKKSANAGKLSPADFHDWVHKAEEMEEQDIDDIIKNFLSTSTAPLMEKEMLSLILDHATSLSEKQIQEIFTAQKKVMELTGKTKAQFDETFLSKVIYMAVDKTYKSESMDFIAYKKLIAQYYPAVAALETEKVKARFYKQQENNKECLDAVRQLLTNKSLGLDAYELAMAMANYSDVIVAEKQSASFLQMINNYQLQPAEKDKGYYKNMALMILHIYMDDKPKAKSYAQKIINDKLAPEEIKQLAEKAIE
jgi:thiol-disulfide isomerase/thioredoxin